MSGALRRTLERRSDTVSPLAIKDWLGRIHGPGQPSTPASASRLAVVQTCIRIYAEAVASLPFICYRRLAGDDRERDPGFYLSELLQYEPNPEMTAVTFIETLTSHVVGWGNGYAQIVRDGTMQPRALWPLRPDRMTVLREGGRLIYRYTRIDGTRVDYRPEDIFHIPGLAFDGLVGYSVLANQRAIELAQAAEEYGEAVWRNNARPGIVAIHPKNLSEAAQERIKAKFERMKGPENAGKTLVLEEGLTIKEVGIPPAEAQYIETRKFQRMEIVSLFLIPPHRTGDTDRSTSWGSGIAEQNQQWLDMGLGMYLRRWEQAVRKCLITDAHRPSHYGEFLRDALLRGDPLKRAQIQHIRWMDGNLSADEIRRMENQNSIPDGKGKGYYVPLNMLPVDQAGTVQQAGAIRSWMTSPNPPALPDPMPPGWRNTTDIGTAATEGDVT